MATEEPTEVKHWVRLRVLGSGGFGVVTLWKHKTKDELIALKKCRVGTDSLLTPKHKERWAKEVEIMQRLSHPNVVRAVPVPADLTALRSELPVLCMEFCSKGDLRQMLNHSDNCCGLHEGAVRALIMDVKNAVQFLHLNKITHRDLKPENIVLQEENNKIVYKLIDLGYAKELDQSSVCTSFVGTLQYVAPELFMSEKYGCSVDYWSLGLVSHEVITGVRPFLPNMHPVKWMSYVRSKEPGDICAYEASDGTIVFSKELFPETHISSSLRELIQEWLRVVLEWDPKKRGNVTKGPEGIRVAAFERIDEILNSKILSLFIVHTYEFKSYKIDDTTTVGTLQKWIESDTQLQLSEQELVQPSGETVRSGDETAASLWRPSDPQASAEEGVMLFVFRRGTLTLPSVTPHLPLLVRNIMENPRTQLSYAHRKRTWSHAVFFLQQEARLYRTLLNAFHVKRKQLACLCRFVCQQVSDVQRDLVALEAQHSLASNLLQYDEHQAKGTSVAGVAEAVADWKMKEAVTVRKLRQLREIIGQLEKKVVVVGAEVQHLQAAPTWEMNSPIMDTLVQHGIECLDTLRRCPREERGRAQDSEPMVRVVYHALKNRDGLLRDPELKMLLLNVAKLQMEVEQASLPLLPTRNVLDKVSGEVRQNVLDRQQHIWKWILVGSGTNHSSESEPCNDVVPPAPPPVKQLLSSQQSCLPPPRCNIQADQQSGDHRPILGASTVSHIDVMKDNEEIRCATVDVFTQSFLSVSTILKESAFDWTFAEDVSQT